MSDLPTNLTGADWRLATWEGAKREQLRRWAELPLDRIIAALQEMQELVEELGMAGEANASDSTSRRTNRRP